MKINEKNLCTFATTPPFDLEGFLNKRGEVNKSWQRRYFVLKGNLLFYFEKKTDRDPLGLIVVEGCTIELAQNEDQFSFQMVFNGNRTYILSAECQETMEYWMKALTTAGYEYKKLMLSELQRQLKEIEELSSKRKNSIDEQLATTTGSASNTPKPPPRRTNPFNRPAPLPPAKPARTPSNVSEKQPGNNINNNFANTSLSTESALNPETHLAKSSFYVRSAPSLPPASKYKPEDQEVNMPTPAVDFAVFRMLHERFKQQVDRSTRQYYEIKESATKLIEF